MASQTQGIQQLLAAEKRADEKVNNARKRKALRLRKAKEDAQVEIHKFRDEKERAFKEYEAQHMGSREDNAARIEMDTRAKIEAMNNTVIESKDDVIQYLISQVFDVKPQVHQNLHLDKK